MKHKILLVLPYSVIINTDIGLQSVLFYFSVCVYVCVCVCVSVYINIYKFNMLLLILERFLSPL